MIRQKCLLEADSEVEYSMLFNSLNRIFKKLLADISPQGDVIIMKYFL